MPSDRELTDADAHDFLRGHSAGVLNCDGTIANIRYVLGEDGSPVTSGRPGFLTADSTVLFIPADMPDVLELLVTVETADSESANADRWRIYHGRPDEPAFYRLRIDAGKWRGQVFEGDELTQPNPLASVEPAICRWMNSKHRSDLIGMSRLFDGVELDEAVMGGVDPAGFDLRAKAGIIRIRSPHRLESGEQARAVLEQMRRQSRGDQL